MEKLEKNIYPLDENTAQVERHVRSYVDGCVNLTRCELIHPDLNAIYQHLPSIDLTKINQYPNIELTSSSIAKLIGLTKENIILSAGSDSIIAYIIRFPRLTFFKYL